jgi:uncharacterized membrane protein
MMSESPSQRNIGRSILALVAGIVVGIAVTLITDAILHKVGFYPPLGVWTPSGPLTIATAYRLVYGILGAYIVARLAPTAPMGHALISGAVGVVATTAGAIATWNSNLGPHWYPTALIITALPTAWVGGKIRLGQMRDVPADRGRAAL